MAEKILMPRLSDTMTEGVVASWNKNVGDQVKKGDLLAEIETDKATMDLESFKSGILLHRGAEEGAAIPVNALLAIVGNEGEDISALLSKSEGAPASKDAVDIDTSPKQEPASGVDGDSSLLSHESIVIMPRLSDTIKQGTISVWHKQVGDKVEKGDLLAEVGTDKATMDLESFKSGTLLYTAVSAGGSVNVNDILCIIGDDSTPIEDIVAVSKIPASASPLPQEQQSVYEKQVETQLQESEDTNRIKASPLAKKIAKEYQLSLSNISGTGDKGRIIKKDVEQHLASGPKEATTVSEATSSSHVALANSEQETLPASYQDTPVSRMRSIIAQRLLESKQTIPHFYLRKEVCFDRIVEQRKKLNELSPVKISLNDILIKVCATALKLHPEVNVSWLGDIVRQYNYVHIGSAVAIPDGLVVPVVKHADKKSLSAIATETKSLYQKAKDKKLESFEFSGGCMTISNLGMMGIDNFDAIINPPESCILAVGSVNEVVVSKGGHNSFGIENRLLLTLSCDHRVVDGAIGASFLNTIAGLIENPLSLLV